MFELSVRQHFDAAHALRGYKGKCENLHGHRFEVVAGVSTAKLNDIGIGYDFLEIKRLLNSVISKLDHANLNETTPFDKINPSSENIASTVYGKLKRLLPKDVKLDYIEVWESPENRVVYRE